MQHNLLLTPLLIDSLYYILMYIVGFFMWLYTLYALLNKAELLT